MHDYELTEMSRWGEGGEGEFVVFHLFQLWKVAPPTLRIGVIVF